MQTHHSFPCLLTAYMNVDEVLKIQTQIKTSSQHCCLQSNLVNSRFYFEVSNYREVDIRIYNPPK